MSSQVAQLLDEFWQWRLRESPEFATQCGVHDYDDRLDDYSLTALAKRQEDAKAFQDHCTQLLSDLSCTDDDKLNLSLLKEDLAVYMDGYKHKGFVFCLTYSEGIHVDFELFTSWMQFNTETDYRRYLSRLKALPKRIQDVQELLKHGIDLGLTHYSKTLEGVLDVISGHEKPDVDTVFYEPLQTFPATFTAGLKDELQNEAKQTITKDIQPAFLALKKFVIDVYVPKTRSLEGVSSLPSGLDFYKACLQWHTSLPLEPQEVHDKGRAEMARIRVRMEEVMKKLGFSDFKEFLKHLREQKCFYYNTKEELMQGYSDVCTQQIRPKLQQSKLFHNIPKSQLILEASPPSRPDAPVGYYLAGTLDGSRPGKFYVNAHKLSTCPKYEMMTLSLHEGEPGHHFQGMYAIESQGVPKFRQYLEDMNYFAAPSRFPLHTAYLEGWGLYCEFLGEEMGLYEDPYSLFGHLSFEMHRACRLVVDTGLHCFGWTFDQAAELFRENTALAEAFIQSEMKRYITWPGQCCAYKIGQLKLKELRQKCLEKLGDKFDVRDFHEVVLKSLPVPLNVLETMVDQYIAQSLN